MRIFSFSATFLRVYGHCYVTRPTYEMELFPLSLGREFGPSFSFSQSQTFPNLIWTIKKANLLILFRPCVFVLATRRGFSGWGCFSLGVIFWTCLPVSGLISFIRAELPQRRRASERGESVGERLYKNKSKKLLIFYRFRQSDPQWGGGGRVGGREEVQ